MTTSTDQAFWVLRAQRGDREALELLLRSLQAPLLRYLRGLAGSDDAEDLLQDVLVLIYRHLRWLDRPDLLRPWAFRIASRRAFRHLKKTRRYQFFGDEVLNEIAADEGRPASETLALLSRDDVVSPASRAVLILHYQEDLTLPEVAAALELPIGTVRSRLAYGLAVLRKWIAEKGYVDVRSR